jgi:hypothetical protein
MNLLMSRPTVAPPGHVWLSAREAAQVFGRSREMVCRWCRTGTVLSFGIRIARDVAGRWYLCVPKSTVV